MAFSPESINTAARVAVVGGGLAGLAAAVAARDRGFTVELFEARSRLGGRAGSFCDPVSGEEIDHCQHVSMGCCTNLADFCRRTGVADCFRRDRRLWFVGPDCRIRPFAPVPFLPSPLHLAPGLMRLGYLRFRDRLRIGRTMLAVARETGAEDIDVASWLRRRGESDEALERFWSVLLVSALGETLERASLAAARKVVVDGLLASTRAYEVEVPRVPLAEIYDRRIGRWLRQRGVKIHLRTPVRCLKSNSASVTELVLRDGSQRGYDFFVVAVPWRAVPGVLGESLRSAMPNVEDLRQLQPSPITAVHLWYDRPILALPHAVLVGRLSQWIFNRATSPGVAGEEHNGHHYQAVISASRDLKGRDRDQVANQVHKELSEIWPAARSAKLLRWKIVTNPEAVFSAAPGIDSVRPHQETTLRNLLLAGDWTATGWPATMEGAVRSGYLAVEAMLRAVGRNERVLAPDLPRGWLLSRLLPGE